MPRSKSSSKSSAKPTSQSSSNSQPSEAAPADSSSGKSKLPPVQIDELFQSLSRYEHQRLKQKMHQLWQACSPDPLCLGDGENTPTVKRTAPKEPHHLEEPEDFGQTHFGAAQLGDVRRRRRLVYSANVILSHPGGTLPERFQSPNDLRAFYDLCDRDRVTHAQVLAPHVLHTLQQIAQAPQTVLVIHDQTELDFTSHRSLRHLGQIGNGSRRGYLAHNSLAVDPCQGAALGLLGQILHCRPEVPKNETEEQRRQRESRESRLWLQGVEGLPSDWRLVDVCDRGADSFEFLSHEWHSGRRFVIRVRQTNRSIQPGHHTSPAEKGQRQCLDQFIETLKAANATPWTVEVQASQDQPARQAQVWVAAAPVTLQLPQNERGEYLQKPLPVWLVRIWEKDPPAGVKPLHWLLYTNEPVETLEDIRRVQHWYELRWIVEEFHKGQKTGCEVENLQFTEESRLQPVIALLSVVAWKLLNLRDLARRSDAREVAAEEVIASSYVEVLSRWRHRSAKPNWSVHEFYYALARLGGHQNRRCDGFPGWLVLWRGWMKLHTMMKAAAPLLEENRKLAQKIDKLKQTRAER